MTRTYVVRALRWNRQLDGGLTGCANRRWFEGQGQRPRRTRSCGADRLPLIEARAVRMRGGQPRTSIPT